jgi:hypothetical protein
MTAGAGGLEDVVVGGGAGAVSVAHPANGSNAAIPSNARRDTGMVFPPSSATVSATWRRR